MRSEVARFELVPRIYITYLHSAAIRASVGKESLTRIQKVLGSNPGWILTFLFPLTLLFNRLFTISLIFKAELSCK